MKVEILKTATVVCQKGSIVEISEDQYKALGNLCKVVKKKKTAPKGGKKQGG